MSRRSWILFLTPVLIWSTTFYAITLQLGSVTTPTYAVGLRFGCAAALLFAWLTIRNEPISLSIGIQSLTALSGLCAYGISYVLTYIAEQTIPSGLAAIAFTLMVFLTPALARLTYRTPIIGKLVSGWVDSSWSFWQLQLTDPPTKSMNS